LLLRAEFFEMSVGVRFPPIPVTGICRKSWGSRPEATFLPPSILIFLPSRGLDSPGGLGRATGSPAFSLLMQFMQSNSHKMHIDV